MPDNQEPLQAVSNVIELNPDKKYLLVYKGELTQAQLALVQEILKAQKVSDLIVHLDNQEMSVIEMPE